MAPEDTSRPRLAAGCRWGEANGAERMLLYPEGAIRLQGTGLEILQRCDGRRTMLQIVEELQTVFSAGDPVEIRAEVAGFLERLRQKRIVDF